MSTETYTGKTHEEYVAEVTGRYSVQDLVEQTPEAMAEAIRKFTLSPDGLVVLEKGTTNFVHWWRIKSGENVYEVRRFQNFVFCSCAGFFYRKQICRHAALTIGVRCWDCFVLSAQGGQLCKGCEAKAGQHRMAA